MTRQKKHSHPQRQSHCLVEIRIRIWIGAVSAQQQAQSFLLPLAEVHCASLSRQVVHLGCL